jgi:putative ABC transport system ATP-binding protein
LGGLSRARAAAFRGRHIGFVFQDFNLIPVLSAAENIEYSLLMVQSWPAAKRRARVAELLAAVGMAEQADKRPDQLSGGQKQRVAVARALATGAELVLADEPTANLDGETFLFSTHDPRVIGAADRLYRMEEGAVREEQPAVAEAAHA